MAAYDLDRLKQRIAGIRVEENPALVRQKSRDFYWYSPVLKRQLDHVTADIVIAPASEAEVLHVMAACFELGIPVTPRGDVMIGFPTPWEATRFANGLSEQDGLLLKNIAVVAAPIPHNVFLRHVRHRRQRVRAGARPLAQPGDVIELDVSKLGLLRSRVVKPDLTFLLD